MKTIDTAAATHSESPLFTLQVIERLPRVTQVHHVESGGDVWATSGRTVLRRRAERWEPFGRLPFAPPRDWFGWCRPLARPSRADKCNLYVTSQGRLLAIRASRVYRFRADGSPEPMFSIQGDCVLHRGICEDADGWVYFGEYFRNPDRQPVTIWRVTADLSRWEPAHRFPASSVRHVHAVHPDPYEHGVLWATVGDDVNECYLVKTTDGFATIEWYGDGSQAWRAVNLYFTPTHVAWLTDSHTEQNYACRMSRADGTFERGQPIPCSSWYGMTTTDGLHLGFTTVEKGAGIQRQESSVLVSDDAFTWHEAASFRKDAWRPIRLFKYGVISCPSGPADSTDVFLSGEGLIGLDGASLRVRVTQARGAT